MLTATSNWLSIPCVHAENIVFVSEELNRNRFRFAFIFYSDVITELFVSHNEQYEQKNAAKNRSNMSFFPVLFQIFMFNNFAVLFYFSLRSFHVIHVTTSLEILKFTTDIYNLKKVKSKYALAKYRNIKFCSTESLKMFLTQKRYLIKFQIICVLLYMYAADSLQFFSRYPFSWYDHCGKLQ